MQCCANGILFDFWFAKRSQGRQWPAVRAIFLDVWTMAIRVIDDIKESVRQSGFSLCRTLRSLTLRLVDPQFATAAHAQEVGHAAYAC